MHKQSWLPVIYGLISPLGFLFSINSFPHCLDFFLITFCQPPLHSSSTLFLIQLSVVLRLQTTAAEQQHSPMGREAWAQRGTWSKPVKKSKTGLIKGPVCKMVTVEMVADSNIYLLSDSNVPSDRFYFTVIHVHTYNKRFYCQTDRFSQILPQNRSYKLPNLIDFAKTWQVLHTGTLKEINISSSCLKRWDRLKPSLCHASSSIYVSMLAPSPAFQTAA